MEMWLVIIGAAGAVASAGFGLLARRDTRRAAREWEAGLERVGLGPTEKRAA